MTGKEVIAALQLSPHPEGGWYRRVYESDIIINGPGGQKCGSAIYYLLESGDFSTFHRLEQDELLHFYLGSPLEVHLFSADGYLLARLGSDLLAGECPMLVVKAGTIYAFAPAQPRSFSLIGCSVFPEFLFSGFEMPSATELTELFPNHQEIIKRYART